VIENDLLLEELGHRNADLPESNRRVSGAPEHLAAMADVLRVIASSPRDLTRILATIAETAT
jgi:hypothetical protein